MKASPYRLLAAFYGSDQEDAEEAFSKLKVGKSVQTWLTSASSNGHLKVPKELSRFSRTLLPGERLILVRVEASAVKDSVEQLRSVGAPAVFVLSPGRPVPTIERAPSEALSGDSLRQFITGLAESHGPPAPPLQQQILLKRLEESEAQLDGVRHELLEAARLDHTLTTAAEWLLDNVYLFRVNIAEVRENLPKQYHRILPSLTTKPGTYRIHEIAYELVRHTDFVLTSDNLIESLDAYQSVQTLSIAELWVAPLVLRLSIIEALARLANIVGASQQVREFAYLWANRLVAASRGQGDELPRMLSELDPEPYAINPHFITSLSEQLREEDRALVAFQEWIEQRVSEPLGELVRREHHRETTDRVSIANAVSSLRQLSRIDFKTVFESVSVVEKVLRCDPSGIYVKSDFSTRDRCRRGVEDIARTSARSETEVARLVIDMADKGQTPIERNAAYYLIAEGRFRVERALNARPRIRTRLARFLRRHATAAYLSTICLLTLAFLTVAFLTAAEAGVDNRLFLGLLMALVVFPLSELALQVTNALVISIFPPDELPSLSFDDGIPTSTATLVVIPMMLGSQESIRREIEKLEVRYLGNPEEHLYFALFPDYLDAQAQHLPGDSELLATAREGIEELNRRYGSGRFYLYYRERVWSESEQAWMGRERKRGKIEELNAYLCGEPSGLIASAPIREPIRYVITLDADTQLPAGTGRRMIATIAHPLNRIELSPDGRRRLRGYTIMQPRVSIGLPGATVTRFTRVFADASGTDPYCRAVSDVYQDLFRESIFHGKAIYDVKAFHSILHNRFPDETLLSHDLIEGAHAGVAAASAIELFENLPADYAAFSRRQHRWIRGDWQIASWIFGKVPSPEGKVPNPLSTINRWRILDNLRRSLVPPTTIALLLCGWFGSDVPGVWTLLVVLAAGLPGFAPLSERLARRLHGKLHGVQGVAEDMLRVFVTLALLPHQAWISVDAIGRVIYRRFISRRHLLEWQTAEQAESAADHHLNQTLRQCIFVSGVSVLLLIILGVQGAFWSTAFFLISWALAPLLIIWLGQRTKDARVRPLDPDSRSLLRRLARQTWRYFDELVNEENNFLPPDNTQLALRVEVAQRTSPTNIGLYLTSALAARDFGYITTDDFLTRATATLETLRRLEKYEGHWLNWYDTRTGDPLLPRYVSTVDSGNLLASFWVLQQGLADLLNAPVIGPAALHGLADSLAIVEDALGPDMSVRLPLQALSRLFNRRARGHEIVDRLLVTAQPLRQLSGTQRWQLDTTDEGAYWVGRLERQINDWIATSKRYMPWLDTLVGAPDRFLRAIHPSLVTARRRALHNLPSLAALASGQHTPIEEVLEYGRIAKEPRQTAWVQQLAAEYEQSRRAAAETTHRIHAMISEIEEMASSIDMGFLYDSKRRLFGIGYQVGNPLEFTSHYDLLASECRLGSLVAIAKGDVPLDHWLALGRPYVSTPEGQVLLSWTGTMFEYLMPILYTRPFENSFLEGACRQAVMKQQEYARQKGIPWGISESAYSALDANQTYQYRAFGTPSLGLKPGLEDDLVVSPYSSFLALQVFPQAAAENLERLSKDGLAGPMGLYESVDFNRERKRGGSRGVVTFAYMAHHQGMSLLALDNALHNGIMQRRFHDDLRIRAVESLLFEKIPSERSLLKKEDAEQFELRVAGEPEGYYRTWQEDSSVPRAHLLGNGRYSVVVTSAGSGYSRWSDLDIASWRADTTLDRQGTYIYIRDLKTRGVWSATYQPIGGEIGSSNTNFSADRVEFVRRANGIDTVTDVCVAPDVDAEIRRVVITNRSLRKRYLEVTSYLELALAPHNAERAHPTFSKLFVETEYLEHLCALIAHRRGRSPNDPPVWAAQVCVAWAGHDPLQFETSRKDFLGRAGTVANPQALSQNLRGTVGTVLDPIFSLRCRFSLDARDRMEVCFITLAADSRETLLSLIERFRHTESITRAFEMAWTQAQLDFRYLGIGPSSTHRYQELLGPMVYPNARLRPPADRLVRNRLGQSGLWAHGISGDVPILAVTVGDARGLALAREVLIAHTYWRMRGFKADLVLLNQEGATYDQPLRTQLQRLVDAHTLHTGLNRPGGVFLRDWRALSEADRTLLLSAAHVLLAGSRGTLGQQLTIPGDVPHEIERMTHAEVPPEEPSAPLPFLELPYFNGIGGFLPDGREYAIYLKDHETTPLPWTNVLASQSFGTALTESGLGFTWYGNSQANRLTPWSNDSVSDPQSEIVYIRDEDSGTVWTPTPLPIREQDAYRARHGQGYTLFEHNSHAISQELRVFVPLDGQGGDPIKIAWLRLRNDSGRDRTLSVTWYVEWVLGVNREDNQLHVQTSFDVDSATILARNPWSPNYSNRVAFAGLFPLAQSWTGDRARFLGRNGSHVHPDALTRVRLDNRTGAGLDPVAALQNKLHLHPGETVDVFCYLGQTDTVEGVRALIEKYRGAEEVKHAFNETSAWWDRRLSTIQVQTPSLSVDLLLNRWLLYQSLSCRFWGRSAFYQSGGAYGFRDQLQDSMALVYIAPDIARPYLLMAASRQFPEGDVQHWWHPETGAGPRTRCSDDMLWLPYVVSHYVKITGDYGILEEPVPFVQGPQLTPEQHEVLFSPSVEPVSETLLEHCLRAIERGYTLGEHGIPLMGNGDWNDGMNYVGPEGRGESVWLAWFLVAVLREFAPVAARVRGEAAAHSLLERADQLVRNIDASCWDGEWYLRAFFDDGSPLGSHVNEEARIDSIPQSWSVIAGGGDPDRARQAVQSAVDHLVRDDYRAVLLFTPAFDKSKPHPGYIMGYPPGLRENGGQYTHGSLWLPLALTHLARGNDAVRLLQLMNPVEATRDPKSVLRYEAEPYVTSADVYSSPNHLGRAGWTWYTGSAAWMYRIWLESVLGFRLRGEKLLLDPVLPKEWKSFQITYRHGEAIYRIQVEVVEGLAARSLELDGEPAPVSGIPLSRLPGEHTIRLRLPG